MFHRTQQRRDLGRMPFAAAAMAFAGLLAASGALHAQSGARQQVRSQGSTQRSASASNTGLDGYCPVCIVDMKKWVKGKAAIQAKYDGKTYYFPGQEQRDAFLANPAKYVPALGGDCVACYVNMGKRVPGTVHHAAYSQGRLFLFPNRDLQQEFLANAQKYTDVDLALNGNCSVCRVEMGKDVPGKPEIAVVHNGLRYLFPSEQQRQMFLANPAKYEVTPPTKARSSRAAPESREQLVKFSGKSGCAACDHGVTPVGSPDELGLAVKAVGGEIYVVEDAHKLYPDLYERRFDELPLEGSGRVIKQQGKFTWVQPTQVRVVN